MVFHTPLPNRLYCTKEYQILYEQNSDSSNLVALYFGVRGEGACAEGYGGDECFEC